MHRKSDKLRAARVAKNDEFYTMYCDIEKECSNYLGHFFGKIIYCNCDTDESNFVKYFQDLKNRGLIKDLLYSGGLGGLDFRSPESIEKLTQADIVISNPPFSLFREYTAQLIRYDKKFLIIGSKCAIVYKEIFKKIKDNTIWFGTRPFGGHFFFSVPDKSENFYKIENNVKFQAVPAIWFTNLDNDKNKSHLYLEKKYYDKPLEYPKYDNANAININKTKNIPVDYNGIMGVPISFFDKYNSQQFKILGLDKDFTTNRKGVSLNKKCLYTRIFIQKKSIANDNNYLIKKAA